MFKKIPRSRVNLIFLAGNCFIVRCHVTLKNPIRALAARVKFQLQLYKTITQITLSRFDLSPVPKVSVKRHDNIIHGYQLGHRDFIPSLYAFSFHGVYALAKITLIWIGPLHSFKHYFSLFKLITSTVGRGGGGGEGGGRKESLLLNFSSEIRFTKRTPGILLHVYWNVRGWSSGKFWTSLSAW